MMPNYVYVAAQDDNQIAVFTIDGETGRLTRTAEIPMPGGPSLLAIRPNRQCLYVGHRQVPEISRHRIDPATGPWQVIPAGGPHALPAQAGRQGHSGATPRAPAAGYSAAHTPTSAGSPRYRSTRASPRAASHSGAPGPHRGHNTVGTWSPGPRRPTRRDRPRYTHRPRPRPG